MWSDGLSVGHSFEKRMLVGLPLICNHAVRLNVREANYSLARRYLLPQCLRCRGQPLMSYSHSHPALYKVAKCHSTSHFSNVTFHTGGSSAALQASSSASALSAPSSAQTAQSLARAELPSHQRLSRLVWFRRGKA